MTYEEFIQTLNKAYRDNPELVKLVQDIADSRRTATFAQAQEYAIKLGEVLGQTISATGVLSDEEMIYTAEYVSKLLKPALMDAYELSTEAAMMVQDQINASYGLGLKSVKPDPDMDRINNLITEVFNKGYEAHKTAINEQLSNLTQSAVDKTITTNGKFLEHSGVTVKYTRIPDSGACKWCRSLAGTYETYRAPDGFFGHHTNCKCIIKLEGMKPTGKVNYWTKKYDKALQEGRIKEYEDNQ